MPTGSCIDALGAHSSYRILSSRKAKTLITDIASKVSTGTQDASQDACQMTPSRSAPQKKTLQRILGMRQVNLAIAAVD